MVSFVRFRGSAEETEMRQRGGNKFKMLLYLASWQRNWILFGLGWAGLGWAGLWQAGLGSGGIFCLLRILSIEVERSNADMANFGWQGKDHERLLHVE